VSKGHAADLKPANQIQHRRAVTNRTKQSERRKTANKQNFPITSSAPILPANFKTQIHLSEVLPKIMIHWSKPVFQTTVSGDLHRLASRITLRDLRGDKIAEYSAKDGNPKELVSFVLTRISETLEEKSISDSFISLLESAKHSTTEIRHWTEQILCMAGEDSKTVALCKTLSQNIISPVASQIKIIFALSNGLIKDGSTSPDGWRIIIEFHDDYVNCAHIRKETSMNLGENTFEFQWKLEMKFSKDLKKLEKVELRLTGLNCHEAMPMEQKQKLVQLLEQMVVD
jgi:hypothetical protein